jgi:hypothetical protein
MNNDDFQKIKEKDEVLVAVFRKSMIPYARSYSIGLIIGVIFIVIGSFFSNFTYSVYAFLIGFAATAFMFMQAWYSWNKSLFFITNLRVIALTQKGFFTRIKDESYLADICQSAAQVKGFKQSLFKYGRVLVQTEAELWLEDIEHPEEVKEIIFDEVGKLKHKETQALPNRFWKMKNKQSAYK